MCRALGIPCNVMSNKSHAWNLVWLDGRWRVFDLTEDVQRKVYGADATKVENAGLTVRYDGFCEPAKAKFGAAYSVGTNPHGLDAASMEKHLVAINTYGLYTRENIEAYLGLSSYQRACWSAD